MEKIKLDIVALSHSVTHSHNYAIILGVQGGTKRLPIVIGGFEAQAIAVALENMVPNRPLTHDLFKSTLDAFNINIKEIIINQLMEGIFYSILVCEKDGKTYNIDSRTSDAIAMAVRYNAPIYTYKSILEIAGVEMDDNIESKPEKNLEEKDTTTKTHTLQELDLKALDALLNKALEREDYEKAAEIRDEINSRKK
jgi:bifunctional DNase/RNase